MLMLFTMPICYECCIYVIMLFIDRDPLL